jgi:glutamyl-tRNA reductase
MDAVHAGKRARTETAISQHTTSVSHVAALLAQPHLGRARRALLLGAGEMARSAASALLQHGAAQVIVANRTYDAAQALAEQVNAALPAGDERVCAIEWSRLWNALAASDVVMTATAAPHTLLHAPDLRRVQAERGGRPLVLIDIAVPRNVDPLARTLQGVTVFDMDDLQRVVDHHLAQRQACVPQVEAIIAEASQTFAAWLASRRVVPVIKDLRHRLQAVVQDELALAMTRLNDLDDAERAVLQRFAHRVVNKLLHAPTATLHERANSPDAETYAGVLREMFALDQADTARGA